MFFLLNRKHYKEKESGQAIIEFALVLPFLLLLLCGIIDFGWILSCQNELTNAAGETARYAAIYANSEDVENLTEEFLSEQGITGTPHLDSLTIDETYATVIVSEDIPFLTGLTGCFFGKNTITLHGKASMPIEPYETEEETDEIEETEKTDEETETNPPDTEPETTVPETSETEPETTESIPETSETEQETTAHATSEIHLVNSTNGMSVTLSPQNSWGDGNGTRYQINVVITNTTGNTWGTDWNCSVDFGASVTNPVFWGPSYTASGNVLTLKASDQWNGNISANGTYSFSGQITVPQGTTLSKMTIR